MENELNYSQEKLGMDGIPLETNYQNYRAEKTELAKQYQDFVCEWIAKNYGMVLSLFTSKKYQYKIGETLQGVEIKYDIKRQETGNIYIEIAEKAYPRSGNYYPSGIYRNDNTWLYFIGDYEVLYIFSKKQLITIHEKEMYFKYIPENETKTSQGFLLNSTRAEKFCIQKINFNNV